MRSADDRTEISHRRAAELLIMSAVATALFAGCYAPLRSYGIPARSLPDEFRMPGRTAGYQMNYALLTIDPPPDYLLGPGDVLEISISGLYVQSEINPLKAEVMSSGSIELPMVGAVRVESMNLVAAQRAITAAYADGFLKDPRVRVSILQRATESVVVLGEVRQPGVVVLSKYENDVAHAIAAAQGLSEDAADIVEVHRRRDVALGGMGFAGPKSANLANNGLRPSTGGTESPSPAGAVESLTLAESVESCPLTEAEESLPLAQGTEPLPAGIAADSAPGAGPTELLPFHTGDVLYLPGEGLPEGVLSIPLRGPNARPVAEEEVVLKSGDVVVVPSRRHEVFYVVGRLRTTNAVRFTVGNRDRELGIGFILPRDREVDVVTAVAMAGYIDPIDSPTTVTVHRVLPDGQPLLIHIDLIAARYDHRETVFVQPGDIIYLNPDAQWWWRYMLDRVMPALITLPYAELFRP